MKKNLFILMAGALALCACDPSGKEPGNGPTPPPAEPAVNLEWAYEVGYKFAGQSVAVDQLGNVYVQPLEQGKLIKLDKSGVVAWDKAISTGTSLKGSGIPSCEPDGSVVYALTGYQEEGAGLAALNGADGSHKWFALHTEQFWGDSKTPNIKVNRTPIAVLDNAIVAGNGGTTGAVLAFNKATGERISYICKNDDGTGGVAGGCSAGPAITKDGYILWAASYVGVAFADLAEALDPRQDNDNCGKYVQYSGFIKPQDGKNPSYVNCCPVSTVINGEEVVINAVHNNAKTDLVIYAVKSSQFAGKKNHTGDQWLWEYTVTGNKQDQGGLVIGKNNEAIVTLKNTSEASMGGILAVDEAGQLLYEYRIAEHVSGAPAVDNNGDIHFATEAGNYYIVRPNLTTKSCEVLASASLTALLVEKGVITDETLAGSVWSDVMIGYDGALHVGLNINNAEGFTTSYVVKLSNPTTTAPCASAWPMKYADASHTCVQK